MSVDIDFWRYKQGVEMDHQEVYEKLSAGEHVEGLEELPLPKILQRLEEALTGWKPTDAETWESDRGIFQIYTTPQFFRVDCYDLSDKEINTVVSVLAEFGCPLFDPQGGGRAEQS